MFWGIVGVHSTTTSQCGIVLDLQYMRDGLFTCTQFDFIFIIGFGSVYTSGALYMF
ncbi:unnamed protein product, partial [Choristocarpus tenellus]